MDNRTSAEKKSPSPVQSFASSVDQATFFQLGRRYKAPSEEDDEDVASRADEAPTRSCKSIFQKKFFKRSFRKFLPSYTPIFMIAVVIIVCIASPLIYRFPVSWKTVFSYAVYIGISVLIFLAWLTLRLLWITCFHKQMVESRIALALSTIIDPELTHFCATLTIALFWAYLPIIDRNYTALGGILKFENLSVKEFGVLLKTNLCLVFWALHSILVNMVVFKFLTRLFTTFNDHLVQYLYEYRFLRILNNGWLQLSPLVLDSKQRRVSETFQPADHFKEPNIFNFDHLRQTVLHSRENYISKLHEYRRFAKSVPRSATEAMKKFAQTEGREEERIFKLPTFLMRSTIERTKTNGIENLLAIEYTRHYFMTLYLKDRKVSLTDKTAAKAFAEAFFDALVELRDALANSKPVTQEIEQKLSQEEKDQLAQENLVLLKRSALERQQTTPRKRPMLLRKRNNGESSKKKPANIATDKSESTERGTIRRQDSEESKADLRFHSSTTHAAVETSLDDDYNFCINLSPILKEPLDHTSVPEVDPGPDCDDPDFEIQDTEMEKHPIIEWREDYSHGIEAVARDFELKTKEAAYPSVYLTSNFILLLLNKEAEEFMKLVDPAGRGIVTKKRFTQLVVDGYRKRKQLTHLVASQEALKKIVSRALSVSLIFALLLLFVFVAGGKIDTIIISGAAVVSSITVILSVLYTGFVQAIIFVCFLNPYNVGDRVVIDNRVRTVKKINLYFTEFYSMLGQVEMLNHDVLFTTILRNDTRCVHAGLELPFLIEYSTPQSKYEALHYLVERYVQTYPEFVQDSFFCILNEFCVDYYVKFTYWITVVDSWGDWKSVYNTQAVLIRFINKQCKALRINFRMPLLPINVSPMSKPNSETHINRSTKVY